MITLHQPNEIFSRRHLPTWLMLAFAAGCVNATALLACERFVTHVTGTVTRIGMAVAKLAVLVDFVLVLAAFIAGSMTASFLINGRAHQGKKPHHTAPLVIVSSVTLLCGVLGHLGYFGRFGGSPDQPADFVLLSLLSFASGLQNAAVATSTGSLVRTTHLTGPATDLGIHLAELAYTAGEARERTKRHAMLRAGKIVAFAGGAAVGVTLASRLGYLALVVPAAIVALATVRSFSTRRSSARRPSGSTFDGTFINGSTS